MEITHSDMAAVKTTLFAVEGHHGHGAAQPKTDSTRKVETANEPATADTPPPSDRILINELEGANDEIRTIARQIRAVDHTMGDIEANLEKMTVELEGIVKHYPPYLGDSQERIAAMRNFSGLRRLIDQLTLPPPDDSPAKILGDKNRFPEAGDWELSMGKAQTSSVIRHQPVHSGTGGLDLPDLATDASDASVQKALDRMPHAHETLRQRRRAFAADANQVMAALI